jgi:hypothetical protein
MAKVLKGATSLKSYKQRGNMQSLHLLNKPCWYLSTRLKHFPSTANFILNAGELRSIDRLKNSWSKKCEKFDTVPFNISALSVLKINFESYYSL